MQTLSGDSPDKSHYVINVSNDVNDYMQGHSIDDLYLRPGTFPFAKSLENR